TNPEPLAARRRVLTEAAIDCALDSRVVDILSQLRTRYRLVLMTDGPAYFQRARIKQMGLDKGLFASFEVFNSAEGEIRLATLAQFLEKNRSVDAASYLVIGNRLDKEICAARALRMNTLWLRHGEGMSMFAPHIATQMADRNIDRLEQIFEVLP